MTGQERADIVSAVKSPEVRELRSAASLPGHYLDDLQAHVAPVAAAIARHARASERPVLVGLNGCQGSGKSTLARFLRTMLQIGASVNCAVVSIDDFYLTRSARQQLGEDIHPLLATRGVPGTHDLTLANSTLDALLDPTRSVPVSVPTFDKAVDNRRPADKWTSVAPDTAVIILEGWCVGCPPQTQQALAEPANTLELEEDPIGTWRQFVNDQLVTSYARLFERMDRLVMLKAPSFDCVYHWRAKQEQQLAHTRAAAEAAATRLMSGAALRRFIHHYERLTRHQLKALPTIADATITLSAEHRMIAHEGRIF